VLVRPHRWILLASFAIGIAGSWAYVTTLLDYRDTADAYTNVDIAAIPETFAWTGEGQRVATLTLEIENSSRTDLTIEHLELRLYSGGTFIGAMYEPWQELPVPSRSVEQVTVSLEVSTPEGRLPEDGQLRLSGDAHLAFEGIDQPFVVRFTDQLEEVAHVE
jgi:hypothetical protein